MGLPGLVDCQQMVNDFEMDYSHAKRLWIVQLTSTSHAKSLFMDCFIAMQRVCLILWVISLPCKEVV